MIYYVTFLRALASCLITNAHYTSIYPTDLIANGGLLGDVLFFAISGFCLSNIKLPFFNWYGKRVYRIYVPVILISSIYCILHSYKFVNLFDFCSIFIYPTIYHFVASIIVLYIPFYFSMKIKIFKENIPWVMFAIALVYFVIYVFFYNKSYYHIDTVREPIIRFLFFESMLLGAYFRFNDKEFRNVYKRYYPLICVLIFFVYIGTKFYFSHKTTYIQFQIINQIVLFVLLYFIFKTFAGLDAKLENFSNKTKIAINFLADHTLEIYLVQIVLLYYIYPMGHFPLNWIIATVGIALSAFILKKLSEFVYTFFDKLILSLSKNKNRKE